MQRQWPSLNAFNTRYVQWEIGGSQEFCRTKINVMHSLEMWKHRNIRSFLTVQFTSPRIIWIFQKWYNNRTLVCSRLESMFSRTMFFHPPVDFHFWNMKRQAEISDLKSEINEWFQWVSARSSSSVRQSVESVELVFTDYLLTASAVWNWGTVTLSRA